MNWNPVKDRSKYGVVVNNFVLEHEYTIQLTVGNTVHIIEEYGDWYFGYVVPNRAVVGIFPKSFIHIKDCIVDRTGQFEVVTPRCPPIIQELTSVLREWGYLIRNLYINRNPEFEKVYTIMNELILERKKMLSGQLLIEEMKQIKHHITDNIDIVNRLLDLDMVVRDDNGNILNPDITSTIKLFRHHQIATEKLQKNEDMKMGLIKDPGLPRQKLHMCWTIQLTVSNLILKVPDPCEVSLAFYLWEPNLLKDVKDTKEGRERLISEPYVFTWTPKGYNKNTDLYSNLVCLFTDLSNKVLNQDKSLYLVGVVVREGAMTYKEIDRRSSITPKRGMETDSIRRPYGMFIKEIASNKDNNKFLQNFCTAETTEIFVPFYMCSEKDSIESMFRKFVTSRNEFTKENNTNLGVVLTLSLLNGDIKLLRKENPHFMPFKELPVSYHLGMTDTIVPGDVRNDLYVTLVGGDFTKDRNVEVTVKVCNENGQYIPGVISIGSGKPSVNQYRSVTYYHEGKPRWMETFKVALPIEEFRKAHLKFTFKHRSTNEVKDKNEKPYALSYVNFIQPNGTTLLNTDHELAIYKIDPKKWSDDDSSYLKRPCFRQIGEESIKRKEECFTLSTKDSFYISTIFCSTKLTQKAELLALLEWGGSGSSSKTDLKKHLSDLRNVPSEELIIFLQDTLDVLFEILMNSSKDVESDNLVFESLVDVIYWAAELNKHESFHSLLDTYIQQNFHATLAYSKLITILRSYIEDVCSVNMNIKTGTLTKAMKCLHYIIKFIVRSRRLFYELHAKGQQTFQESLEGLFVSMAKLMACNLDSLLPVQGLCLKYLATTIPDIMGEFDHIKLCWMRQGCACPVRWLFGMLIRIAGALVIGPASLVARLAEGILVAALAVACCHCLIRIVNNLQDQRLSPQRLSAMCEICHSQLFVDPRCRGILLEAFIAHIKKLFAESEEVTDSVVAMRKERTKGKLKDILGTEMVEAQLTSEVNQAEQLKLSVKILCDILDTLYCSEVGPTISNLVKLMEELLTDLLLIISKMRRDDEMLLQFVALFISMMRQIPEVKFLEYLENYDSQDLMHLLVDLLMVIKDLVENPVFPADWAEMILLENFVLMKLLNLISKVIVEKMKEPFIDIIWNNFFQCAVKFITQPCLQLERFTPSKRNKILGRYKDMRREMARVIKQLWFSLGLHKIRFIVRGGNGFSLVGPFLEMTMLPEVEMRKSTIPIFFDMMQCEFYSSRDRTSNQPPDMAKRDQKIKGKFDEFEREMLEHLDHLVEGGSGDEHYREVFVYIMKSLCKEHTTMAQQGIRFVHTTGTLIEKLLQYRTIMNAPDHSPEIRMSCTVSLLDFYAEINRKELYLRYLYKLFDLHRECDNYTEAGYTLKLHANLLTWRDNHQLPPHLKCSRYSNLNFHHQLKERLYYDIIFNYKKGKMWEAALKICKELVVRYEEVTLEYDKLATLLSEMAKFYENIMNPEIIRPEPEYFRVAYYGRGFPAFLQNKVFIYRGNGYERITDFQMRILDPFPNAEVMKTLSPPSKEDMESAKQHIQINKVECMADNNTRFASSSVAERIRQYYQLNHIDQFSFSRPFHRGQRDPSNEFATLWTEKTILKTNYKLPGLLRCFPVIQENKIELTPLDNAVNQLTATNLELESLVRNHARNSQISLEPLTRKVTGIVDAAVMGGIKNYENAFLTEEYMNNHPEDAEKIDELKRLISKQMPLLELALDVHGIRVSSAMSGLHAHVMEQFKTMKSLIQRNYGLSPKPMDLEAEVQAVKRQTANEGGGSARNSHYSGGVPETSNFVTGLSRISLAVNKANNATLPRSMRLSTSSTPSLRKDKKGFKYLRNRRESFNVRKESNTKWFETNFADEHSSHIATASPVEIRKKANHIHILTSSMNNLIRMHLLPSILNDSDSKFERSLTEPQQSSRPNSLSASLKSTSSTSSLEMDRLSYESDAICSPVENDTVSPSIALDSPPPLPAKNRNLDPEKFSISRNSSFNNSMNGSSDIGPNDEPPEKPPRPSYIIARENDENS